MASATSCARPNASCAASSSSPNGRAPIASPPGLSLRWQETIGPAAPQTRAGHLGAVRPFSAWLHSLDPAHEALPSSLVPSRRRRSLPYICSAQDIRRIVEAAAALPSVNGIHPLSCAALFGLLAVTGMRISEALALDAGDVDLEAGVLTVRRGTLGKARLLPLSGSTTVHLAACATERDRLLGHRPKAFFVSDRGERMTDCSARYNFALVCQRIDLRPATKFNRHGGGPRIHDLRHSFALRTLIGWYRTGKDPAREMLKLSTYLGTPIRPTPTGTSRRHRSCWSWPRAKPPAPWPGR